MDRFRRLQVEVPQEVERKGEAFGKFMTEADDDFQFVAIEVAPSVIVVAEVEVRGKIADGARDQPQ